MKTYENWENLLRDALPPVEALDEMRAKRMEAAIMGRIEKIEKRKTAKYRFAKWKSPLTAAATVLIVMGVTFMLSRKLHFQSFTGEMSSFAFFKKSDSDPNNVAKTILTYKTKDDLIVAALDAKMAKMNDKEAKEYLKQILQ
jgi:hypothetical protein